MKYSGRYNEKILEIYRDIEDKKILNNVDANIRDVAIVLEIRKYNKIKIKRDRDKNNININMKEVAYKEK